jgi:hypothetical protein
MLSLRVCRVDSAHRFRVQLVQLAGVLAALVPFAHCPVGTLRHDALGNCAQLIARRGFMRIGSTQQELTHPIVEQFGFAGDTVVLPTDGTPWMTSSPEQIPGGIFGVPLGASTEVTAQVLPAGPMRFSLYAPTTLPIRVKLTNDYLGPNCFLGPIQLHLQPDVSHADVEPQAVGMILKGLVATDTRFTVPRSRGCNGGGLVDAKLGLPSPAGANAVRLEIDAAVATAPSVLRARRRVSARRRAPAHRHAPRRP